MDISMKQTGILIFIFFLQLNLSSQDISVIFPYYLTSKQINPAYTGVHESRYRLSIRAQEDWIRSSRPGLQSRYYQVSGEMKIARWERDQLSAGFEARHSMLGFSKYATTAGLLSAAYTRQLFGGVGDKSGHFISFGAEYGFGQNAFNYNDLLYGDQIDPTTGNPSGNPSQDPAGYFQVLYGDLSTGLLWYWIEENRFNLSTGLGVYHLNSPDISMLGDDVSLQIRWSSFLSGGIYVARSVILEPGVIIHWQVPHSTAFIGSCIRFGALDTENYSFKTGFWLQGNVRENHFDLNFVHFLVSLGMQKWDVSFGYTMNMFLPTDLINDLRGLSLSMQYYFGTENTIHKLACPRF